jgi:hypothetical protein
VKSFFLRYQQHLIPSSREMEPEPQVGGGVSTRSATKKASRPTQEPEVEPSPSARLQRSTSRAKRSGASSSSGGVAGFPQPQFPNLASLKPSAHGGTFLDHDDFFGSSKVNPSFPPSSMPQPSGFSGAERGLDQNYGTLESSSRASSVSSLGRTPYSMAQPRAASTPRSLAQSRNSISPRSVTPVQPLPQIPEERVLDLRPPTLPPSPQPSTDRSANHPLLLAALQPFLNAPIPENFDVVAAQAPANDEEEGSRCEVSIDGEDEDFDASPSRQRAGRIPSNHKSIIDEGSREIDQIFLRMHRETGRTIENLQNHYLASKGFKRVTRNFWNRYQKYFKKFRLQERIACGNPNAQCESLCGLTVTFDH